MPVKNDREYRALMTFEPSEKDDDNKESYIVTGYAATFEPYLLMTIDDVDYFERIEPHAFDDCDMSDVIMQYDHTGKVLARSSNGTLQLSVDEHGLFVVADLSTTEASRDLYKEIKSGLITKMSFAFKVRSDYFDALTNTRVVQSIAKIFDVSAVSIPANPATEISTRAYLDGVIQKAEAERLKLLEKEVAKKKLQVRLKLMEV